MARGYLTYKASGVDVEKGEQVVENLEKILKSTWNKRIKADVAGFKAVYDDGKNYWIAGSDGVGTKLLVAMMAKNLKTIGQDLVAMCLNDITRVGAIPLFFLDYMATGKLDEESHFDIINGVAEGCKLAEVPLLGGETAELPGMYEEGEFELAGFVVGKVKKEKIIDGKEIKLGATVLGIESSGLHSNGYSLVRKIFFDKLNLGIHEYIPELNRVVEDVLLEPTIIYTKPVLDLIRKFPNQIQGMAHITGGGMQNKLPKVFPDGLGANIYEGSWPVHDIFKFIESKGPVKESEMRNTFNRGIGFIAIVNDSGVIPDLIGRLEEKHDLKSYKIGEVIEAPGIHYTGDKI